MPRDIPLLFSAPMVRALLDGSKTQTRRPLYVVRKFSNTHTFDRRYPPPFLDWDNPQHGPGYGFTLSRGYDVGDRLWVKETIRLDDQFDLPEPVLGGDYGLSHYAADGAPTKADAWPWKRRQLNSIHCPRGLSRITLEVTDVRVERLTKISEADAIAEGCRPERHALGEDEIAAYRTQRLWEQRAGMLGGTAESMPVARYAILWESLNGPGSWSANPWVWCVSFRMV
jgi:hypothetical protein